MFYAKIFGFLIRGILLLRVYPLKCEFVAKSFLTFAAYLVGTYIYSPQFNLLLVPLLAILAIDHLSPFLWDVFSGLIIITWFIGYNQPGWAQHGPKPPDEPPPQVWDGSRDNKVSPRNEDPLEFFHCGLRFPQVLEHLQAGHD